MNSTSSTSTGVCDTLFQEILKERKIDAIGEDVDPFIEKYEQKLGNWLSIKRGERNSFHLSFAKSTLIVRFRSLLVGDEVMVCFW